MKIIVKNPQLNNVVDAVFENVSDGIQIHKASEESKVYNTIEFTDAVIMIAIGAVSTVIGTQISSFIDRLREIKFYKGTSSGIAERIGCLKLMIDSDESNRFELEVHSNIVGDSHEYLRLAEKFIDSNKDRIIVMKDIYANPCGTNANNKVKYEYKIRYTEDNEFEILKRELSYYRSYLL